MRNLTLLLIFMAYSLSAWAIEFSEKDVSVSLTTENVEVYRDTNGTMTEAEAWTSRRFGRVSNLNASYSDDAYWMRFVVHDRSYSPLAFEFDHAQLDSVLLVCRFDGKEVRHFGGDRLPYDSRAIKVAKIAFELPRTEDYTCLARIKTSSIMSLGGRIATLSDVHAAAALDNLISGGFFSVMLLIATTTAIAAIVTGEYAKLSYSAGVVGFALWHGGVTGILFQYVWPSAVWMQNHVHVVAVSCAYCCTSVFLSLMLENDGIGKTLCIVMAGLWALMAISASADATWVVVRNIHPALGLVHLLVLPVITAQSAWRHNNRALKWIFAGKLFVIPPSAASVMLVKGVLPMSPWVGYALLAGVLIELLTFVFALSLSWVDAQRLALDQANKIADERTRDLREVVNAITHDVKNPADAIIKQANTVADSNQSVVPAMTSISANARRIFLFASGVQWREKSRADITIGLSPINLTRIVMSVIEDYRLQLSQQRIRLDVQMPDGLLVSGSDVYARNVVENLVVNVLRHVGDDAILRISGRSDGVHVRLAIEDDGDGTLPKQPKQAGGLAAVESQMRAMRGSASFGRSHTCGGLAANLIFKGA